MHRISLVLPLALALWAAAAAEELPNFRKPASDSELRY